MSFFALTSPLRFILPIEPVTVASTFSPELIVPATTISPFSDSSRVSVPESMEPNTFTYPSLSSGLLFSAFKSTSPFVVFTLPPISMLPFVVSTVTFLSAVTLDSRVTSPFRVPRTTSCPAFKLPKPVTFPSDVVAVISLPAVTVFS